MAVKFKPLDWVENNPVHNPAYSLPPSYQARVYLGTEILVYDVVRLAKDDYRYSVFFDQVKSVDKDFTTNRLDDFSFSNLEDAQKHADYHYQNQMYIRLLALSKYELEELLDKNES